VFSEFVSGRVPPVVDASRDPKLSCQEVMMELAGFPLDVPMRLPYRRARSNPAFTSSRWRRMGSESSYQWGESGFLVSGAGGARAHGTGSKRIVATKFAVLTHALWPMNEPRHRSRSRPVGDTSGAKPDHDDPHPASRPAHRVMQAVASRFLKPGRGRSRTTPGPLKAKLSAQKQGPRRSKP